MKARVYQTALAFVAIAAMPATSFAADPGGHPKRARPPAWSRDVLDTFFDDARDRLDGPRPDYGALSSANGSSAMVVNAPDRTSVPSSTLTWSKLIDATTLETEVKRTSASLDRDVTTPSAFKGGGHQAARRDFSLLAVLFAVTAEHDGQPRWQEVAPALRDQFARAGHNAKAASDASYNEARLRKQELADLIRGSRPQLSKRDRGPDWSQVADLAPLMQRINIAHEERLTKWLADRASFRRSRDEIRHEAQLVAMLAAVISREGFDYWDEEEYSAPANELGQAANELASAAASDDFNQARAAITRATNACTACHEGYR